DGIRVRNVTGVQTCALPIFDELGEPPASFATFLAAVDSDTADVLQSGPKLRVAMGAGVDATSLEQGQEILLNEALQVVSSEDFRSEESRAGKECSTSSSRRQ